MIFIVLVISFASTNTFAGYDDSWYRSKFWSHEYPFGFSVTKRNTTLPARSGMDKDLPRNVACKMPYLAVIHPWNGERIKKSHIEFLSATKIVKLVAKEDFKFDGIPQSDIRIKKGDVIEYIRNDSEGSFEVRIFGKQYTADQNLFRHVDQHEISEFIEDEWVVE